MQRIFRGRRTRMELRKEHALRDKVRTIVRAWMTRFRLRRAHRAATQIQRIARGAQVVCC